MTLTTGLSTAELEIMRSVEDDLWWYRALRGHVLAALASLPVEFELLDAGCGSGGMLARIRERFPRARLSGLDLTERALELSAARNLHAELTQGSINAMPFDDEQFDVVLSLDVIMTAGVDDAAAVRELHRVLRPGGTCIINVPAFAFLRGTHDVAVNAARRYTRPQLAALLHRAGFNIATMTYWNMTLLPIVAVVRWLSRARTHRSDVRSDLAPMWPPANALLSAIARSELALSRLVALPFGTSLFAVASK